MVDLKRHLVAVDCAFTFAGQEAGVVDENIDAFEPLHLLGH